jgi:hypothetical protein
MQRRALIGSDDQKFQVYFRRSTLPFTQVLALLVATQLFSAHSAALTRLNGHIHPQWPSGGAARLQVCGTGQVLDVQVYSQPFLDEIGNVLSREYGAESHHIDRILLCHYQYHHFVDLYTDFGRPLSPLGIRNLGVWTVLLPGIRCDRWKAS